MNRFIIYIKEEFRELADLRSHADRKSMGDAFLPLLIAAILLVLDRYGLQGFFIDTLARKLDSFDLYGNRLTFYSQAYFSISSFVLFVMTPLLYERFFPSREGTIYGLGFHSAIPHLPVYIALLFFMLPVLWLVTGDANFYRFYPMYTPGSLPDWLLYESIYMTAFFSVEFFFRGYTLYRLERKTGLYAIVLMVVPYALIHIHKPFPEALGSIIAGLVLGYLSIRGRSIWPGVALHCSIAFFTDFFSLIHSGRLAEWIR